MVVAFYLKGEPDFVIKLYNARVLPRSLKDMLSLGRKELQKPL
jgi:hypothetical protein